MWPFKKNKKARYVEPPEYIETSYGFRYRFLDVHVSQGFEVAAAQLLPGERLYRMMSGSLRTGDQLSPILIEDSINFIESQRNIEERGWVFFLAAGIPRLTAEPLDIVHHSAS